MPTQPNSSSPRTSDIVRQTLVGNRLPEACPPAEDSPEPLPRIALIRQRYRPDGGAERFVSKMLSALDAGAYDVTLITRRWDDKADRSVITCNPRGPGRIWREWGFARAVASEVERGTFDLVQSNERIDCCDVYRAGDGVHREWLEQRRRVQSAAARLATRLSLYHAYVKHTEKTLFESGRLRAAICNSRMVRDEILSYFNVDADKLRVIYSGVDTEKFHPGLARDRRAVRDNLGVPQDAPVFILVGSGFQRKGVGVAIECLAGLPGAYLLVVGKDKRTSRFQKLAARLGASDRLRLLGVRQDVGPYYGASDALVLPTLYDPFPNVILEAMAAGLPVITSTKCGGAEFIEEGQNGYVCDALDRRGVTLAMQRLTDRNHCRQSAEAARSTVEPYTLDAMQQNLNRLYMELLDDHH